MRRLKTALIVSLATCGGVRADISIRGARITEGDLWVIGEVNEPNATITLDDTFFEKTDSRGRFQFRLGYHPATCTVIVKTQAQSRVVVIGNCGQRGPAGPIGPPGPTGPPGPSGSSSTAEERSFGQVRGAATISCGAQNARYEGENAFQLWVTRRGIITKDNSLRPSSPDQTLVLQVRIGTNIATAYGPDFESLIRGAAPQQIEELYGSPIRWASTIDGLPELLQIVSESSSEVLAKLRFANCGEPPRIPPKRPSPPAAQPASPPTEIPQTSDAPKLRIPRGALE
jgi:hypothetical protein